MDGKCIAVPPSNCKRPCLWRGKDSAGKKDARRFGWKCGQQFIQFFGSKFRLIALEVIKCLFSSYASQIPKLMQSALIDCDAAR